MTKNLEFAIERLSTLERVDNLLDTKEQNARLKRAINENSYADLTNLKTDITKAIPLSERRQSFRDLGNPYAKHSYKSIDLWLSLNYLYLKPNEEVLKKNIKELFRELFKDKDRDLLIHAYQVVRNGFDIKVYDYNLIVNIWLFVEKRKDLRKNFPELLAFLLKEGPGYEEYLTEGIGRTIIELLLKVGVKPKVQKSQQNDNQFVKHLLTIRFPNKKIVISTDNILGRAIGTGAHELALWLMDLMPRLITGNTCFESNGDFFVRQVLVESAVNYGNIMASTIGIIAYAIQKHFISIEWQPYGTPKESATEPLIPHGLEALYNSCIQTLETAQAMKNAMAIMPFIALYAYDTTGPRVIHTFRIFNILATRMTVRAGLISRGLSTMTLKQKYDRFVEFIDNNMSIWVVVDGQVKTYGLAIIDMKEAVIEDILGLQVHITRAYHNTPLGQRIGRYPVLIYPTHHSVIQMGTDIRFYEKNVEQNDAFIGKVVAKVNAKRAQRFGR